ncbi:hypothetical protein QUB63_30115 [Microcoleus sp. ARI1-B5]
MVLKFRVEIIVADRPFTRFLPLLPDRPKFRIPTQDGGLAEVQ